MSSASVEGGKWCTSFHNRAALERKPGPAKRCAAVWGNFDKLMGLRDRNGLRRVHPAARKHMDDKLAIPCPTVADTMSRPQPFAVF
jgi:hypothetical protein